MLQVELLTLVGVQNACVLTILPAASCGVAQILRLLVSSVSH